MNIFANPNEMIKFARDFVKNRIYSLEKDVKYCLRESSSPVKYAPYPALLYCFSTIDLLGYLLKGDIESGTTINSKRYMKGFMNYTTEQTDLLINIFRHKLVHLAEPKFVYRDTKKRNITWKYYHDDAENHLKIEEVNLTINITSTYSIHATHRFNIGIMQLMDNIKDSVERSTGYLDTLETTPNLQNNFSNAIEQIYQNS
jgi:hypothetical protein